MNMTQLDDMTTAFLGNNKAQTSVTGVSGLLSGDQSLFDFSLFFPELHSFPKSESMLVSSIGTANTVSGMMAILSKETFSWQTLSRLNVNALLAYDNFTVSGNQSLGFSGVSASVLSTEIESTLENQSLTETDVLAIKNDFYSEYLNQALYQEGFRASDFFKNSKAKIAESKYSNDNRSERASEVLEELTKNENNGNNRNNGNNNQENENNPGNDAPVLNNAGSTKLTNIAQSNTDSSGDTVASIVGDRITDTDDGAVEGIAIYALDSSNGTWQYTLNSGGDWTNIGTVNGSSALLLSAEDSVRFVPDGSGPDNASFDFYAWDQTVGSIGDKVDVSTRGGSTAFSSDAETATITVTGGRGPPVPPVVLDLDGDGVEFINNETHNVLFDANGDGIRDSMLGWAGSDDAILAFDYNNDGAITETKEIAFTQWDKSALTDLAALNVFDSNQNGLLDAGDESFYQFVLWNDANSDGISDVGELITLTDANIASLNLTSDGQKSIAQGVDIHGMGEYMLTNGETRLLADTAFYFEENSVLTQEGFFSEQKDINALQETLTVELDTTFNELLEIKVIDEQ